MRYGAFFFRGGMGADGSGEDEAGRGRAKQDEMQEDGTNGAEARRGKTGRGQESTRKDVCGSWRRGTVRALSDTERLRLPKTPPGCFRGGAGFSTMSVFAIVETFSAAGVSRRSMTDAAGTEKTATRRHARRSKCTGQRGMFGAAALRTETFQITARRT